MRIDYDFTDATAESIYDGIPPVNATEFAAGHDLRSARGGLIEPGQTALVPTGLMLAIPAGFAGFILPRSGIATQHGVIIPNSPGLIDPDYRGEVKVALHNISDMPFHYGTGDRIAQLVFMTYFLPEWIQTSLFATDRGEGGFGSTGVA